MSYPTPSLDSLRCFVEAARFLNFRSAAKAVALTPAALGQRIRQLEEMMGHQLFHRTTRSVTLTEHGLALLPHAQHALEAAQECVRAGRGELAPPPTEIVLGTRHELGLSWVVPALSVLKEELPHLTIHLYFGSGLDLLAHSASLEIDCAITSSRMMDPRLDAFQLHLEEYVFVGGVDALEDNPLERPDEAANHTLIDINESLPLFRYWRDAPGGVDSMRFGFVRRVGTIAAIRSLVVQGDGVAVLPRYFVQEDIDAGRLQIIMPAVTPVNDYFRLVFRSDDPKRSLFERMARKLAELPLT